MVSWDIEYSFASNPISDIFCHACSQCLKHFISFCLRVLGPFLIETELHVTVCRVTVGDGQSPWFFHFFYFRIIASCYSPSWVFLCCLGVWSVSCLLNFFWMQILLLVWYPQFCLILQVSNLCWLNEFCIVAVRFFFCLDMIKYFLGLWLVVCMFGCNK